MTALWIAVIAGLTTFLCVAVICATAERMFDSFLASLDDVTKQEES